ncbi:hypothetical protein BDP81DRAFT_422371 [Colletotrichum phormii]|uniref:Uncharacterized protein n=1 Tax=Colletotrichum phormii TaxID=359342 RepID=A0AAI9ZUZ7_9PEZI|nr:uncharacterized protein BDP81DRAFT_422371 [Colletotrichum phormii]KAK1638638.1 hypothetical protein BDP81DRAFT_422371 [Colletotrichum phormii]
MSTSLKSPQPPRPALLSLPMDHNNPQLPILQEGQLQPSLQPPKKAGYAHSSLLKQRQAISDTNQ